MMKLNPTFSQNTHFFEVSDFLLKVDGSLFNNHAAVPCKLLKHDVCC